MKKTLYFIIIVFISLNTYSQKIENTSFYSIKGCVEKPKLKHFKNEKESTTNNYDVELTGCAMLYSYKDENDSTILDGFYQLIPINSRSDISVIKTSVKNIGNESADNVRLTTILSDEYGNIIAQKDTNWMNNGQNLTNYLDKDTFECKGLSVADATEGFYTLTSTISFDSLDENDTNNTFSLDYRYTFPVEADLYTVGFTQIARDTSKTTEINIADYQNTIDNDAIGIKFHSYCSNTVTSCTVSLGTVTDNTALTIIIYKKDSAGNWVQYSNSEDFYTSASDSQSNINIDLINPTYLIANEDYMVLTHLHWVSGESSISINAYDGYHGEFSDLYYEPASALKIADSLFYINAIPNIIVNFEAYGYKTQECVYTNVKKPINYGRITIFPNPSKSNINIELININKPQDNGVIYNIDGKFVKEFSMDNSFYKTIDISYLKEGLYFIKLGDLTQKFVKE